MKFNDYPEIPFAEAHFPVFLRDDDRCFHDEDAFLEYCYDNDIDDPNTLDLTDSRPYYAELSIDYFHEEISDDPNYESRVDELEKIITNFNDALRNFGPLYYNPETIFHGRIPKGIWFPERIQMRHLCRTCNTKPELHKLRNGKYQIICPVCKEQTSKHKTAQEAEDQWQSGPMTFKGTYQ